MNGAHGFAEHVAASGHHTLIFYGDSLFSQVFTWASYEMHQSGARISRVVKGSIPGAFRNFSGSWGDPFTYHDLAMATFGSRYFRSMRQYDVALRSGRRLRVINVKIGSLAGKSLSAVLPCERTANATVLAMLPAAHYNLDDGRASFGDSFGVDVGMWLSWLARCAKAARRTTTILAIDAPAQHWPDGINGHFAGNTHRQKPRECAINQSLASSDMPSNDAKNAIARTTLQTRHATSLPGVLWVPFYNVTRDLGWAHSPYEDGTMDCTHYCYVPGVIEPLWKELLAGHERWSREPWKWV